MELQKVKKNKIKKQTVMGDKRPETEKLLIKKTETNKTHK